MPISISISRTRTLARHLREAADHYEITAISQRDRGRAALLRREASHLMRDTEKAVQKFINEE